MMGEEDFTNNPDLERADEGKSVNHNYDPDAEDDIGAVTSVACALTDPENAVVETILSGGMPEVEDLTQTIKGALLENKFMDGLNGKARDVFVDCVNYIASLLIVITQAMRCSLDDMKENPTCGATAILFGPTTWPIIISIGYGFLVMFLTWVHGTYFAKREGESRFASMYNFTDKVIFIDSILEIPIAIVAAPLMTLALWTVFACVVATVFLISLRVGADVNDPSSFLASIVVVYHLIKVTGDLSQYYVLNKTTDTNPETLKKIEKLKKYEEKASKKLEPWSPDIKCSTKSIEPFGRYFITACVIILISLAFGITSIVLGADYMSNHLDMSNEMLLKLDQLAMTSIIVTTLTIISMILLTKATAEYKLKRGSSGIISFRNVGWFFFLLGVGLQTWAHVAEFQTTTKIKVNIACLFAYGISSLLLVIHALGARQI